MISSQDAARFTTARAPLAGDSQASVMQGALTSAVGDLRPGKRFELGGEFAGFVRTPEGKRRMLLRAGDRELELKVPKDLRKRFADTLEVGTAIVVAGAVLRSGFGAASTLVVSHVKSLAPSAPKAEPCATCTIRVCTRKNCWRNGGEQLWSYLERRAEESGLSCVVKLKAVGCLGCCRRAPNLTCAGKDHTACTLTRARQLFDSLAVRLHPHRRY